MACTATLKRSLEFDPVHDSPHGISKRRRCMPRTICRATAPTKQHQITPSPFSNAVPALTTDEIMLRLSEHYKSITHRRHQVPASLSSSSLASASRSPSPPDVLANSSSHAVAAVPLFSQNKTLLHATMSSSSLSDGMSTSAVTTSQRKKDMPLFTLKQVGLVCERMIKEREEHLQGEYENVLNTKLAEQYEAFLKFNQDQLHRRFGESAASYVS